MKQKIVISLIVMAVLSLLLSGCQTTGQAGGVPRIQTPPKPATSCNGDKICEANMVNATGDIISGGNIFATDYNSRIGAYTVGGTKLDINGELLARTAEGIETIYAGCGQPYCNQGANLPFVRIAPLSGTGNAYVCVDNSGRLFRSVVPCR